MTPEEFAAYVLCPTCGEVIGSDPGADVDYYADEECMECEAEWERDG